MRKKDENYLRKKQTLLKYLETGDKDAAKELRIGHCKFYILIIPLSILFVFVILGIPLGLADDNFTISKALEIAFCLAGIPAILSFLFTMLFPALDDESLYIGIAWLFLTAIIQQATGLGEALAIAFLVIIIFCMWYNNNSRQDKIDKVKQEIYSIEK